jgi:hypothetical protein
MASNLRSGFATNSLYEKMRTFGWITEEVLNSCLQTIFTEAGQTTTTLVAPTMSAARMAVLVFPKPMSSPRKARGRQARKAAPVSWCG